MFLFKHREVPACPDMDKQMSFLDDFPRSIMEITMSGGQMRGVEQGCRKKVTEEQGLVHNYD
jgi:hypothetical protein